MVTVFCQRSLEQIDHTVAASLLAIHETVVVVGQPCVKLLPEGFVAGRESIPYFAKALQHSSSADVAVLCDDAFVQLAILLPVVPVFAHHGHLQPQSGRIVLLENFANPEVYRRLASSPFQRCHWKHHGPFCVELDERIRGLLRASSCSCLDCRGMLILILATRRDLLREDVGIGVVIAYILQALDVKLLWEIRRHC